MTLEIKLDLFEEENGDKGSPIDVNRIFAGETFIVEVLAGDFRDVENAGITELGFDLGISDPLEVIAPLTANDNFDFSSALTVPDWEINSDGTLRNDGIFDLSASAGEDGSAIGAGEFSPIAQLTLEAETESFFESATLSPEISDRGFTLADGTTEGVEVLNQSNPLDILPQLEVFVALYESNDGEKGDRIVGNTVNPGEDFIAEFFVQDIREKTSLDRLGVDSLGLDINFDGERFELLSPLNQEGAILPEEAITAQGFDFFTEGSFDPEESLIEGLSGSSTNPGGEDNPPRGEIGRFESFAQLEFQADIGASDPETSEEIPFLAEINPTQGFSLQDDTEQQASGLVSNDFISIAPEVNIGIRLFENADGSKGDPISSVLPLGEEFTFPETISNLINPGEQFFAEFVVRDNRENLPEEELGISGLGLDIEFDPNRLSLISPLEGEEFLPEQAITAEGFTNFIGGEFDAEASLIEGLRGSSIVPDGEDGSPIGRGEFEPFALLGFEAAQTEPQTESEGPNIIDFSLNSNQGLTLADGTAEEEIDVSTQPTSINIAPPVEFNLAIRQNGEESEIEDFSPINPGESFFLDIQVRDNRVNLPEDSTGFTGLGIDLDFNSDVFELVGPFDGENFDPSSAIAPEDFTQFVEGTFNAEEGLIEGLGASSLNAEGNDGSAIGAGEFETFASLEFQANETFEENEFEEIIGGDFFEVKNNATQGFSLRDGTDQDDVSLESQSRFADIITPAIEVELVLLSSEDGEVGEPLNRNRFNLGEDFNENLQESFFNPNLLDPGEEFFLEVQVRDNRESIPAEELGLTGLGIDLNFEADSFELLSGLDEEGNLLPEEVIIPEDFKQFVRGSYNAEQGLIEQLSASSIVLGEENGSPIGAGEFETFARFNLQAKEFFANDLSFDLNLNPTVGFSLQDGSSEEDVTTNVRDQTARITPEIFTQEQFTFEEVFLSNLSEGDVIGQVTINEPERQDALELGIINGIFSTGEEEEAPEATPALTIDSETGEITVNNVDAITEGTSEFTVNATDLDGILDTTTVELTVSDAPENQPPEFAQDAFNFSLDENSAVDTVVGTVAASDPEEDSLSFAIATGNDDVDGDGEAAFTINEQGEILVNDADDLDFETQQQFTLELTVADGNGGEDTATATITVNEVVENEPPEFAQDEFSFNLDENSAVDTVVGTVTASDPEEDLLTFAIATGNDDVDGDGEAAFTINEQGEILVNDADDLDFETQQQFTLEVTVADGNDGEDTATANITLNDVDEVQPPPDLITRDIFERAVDESLIDIDNITSDLLPDAVQQQLQAIAQDLDTEVNTLLENDQIAQIAISPSAQQVLTSLQEADDGITGTPPDFEINSQVPAVV